MFSFRLAALLAAVSLLAGCAAPVQNPVPLRAEAFATPGGRIGVLTTAIPKPDTQFPGAGCLLCIATASAVNSKMTDHVRTWGLEELQPLKAELSQLLRARGQEVVLIEEAIDVAALPERSNPGENQARKDFSALKTKHRVDRLLVVEFGFVGVMRPYSSYFPAGEPYATVAGRAYVLNLGSHAYEWHETLAVRKPAEAGKWDEPPQFPGLTNAYFQAIELTKDQIKRPFAAK
jgi:hypothetical protein